MNSITTIQVRFKGGLLNRLGNSMVRFSRGILAYNGMAGQFMHHGIVWLLLRIKTMAMEQLFFAISWITNGFSRWICISKPIKWSSFNFEAHEEVLQACRRLCLMDLMEYRCKCSRKQHPLAVGFSLQLPRYRKANMRTSLGLPQCNLPRTYNTINYLVQSFGGVIRWIQNRIR